MIYFLFLFFAEYDLLSCFQLVEKLSAVAPDGQAKFKVLNAIAEEHNIQWDSKSFEEKETKPVNDLLVIINILHYMIVIFPLSSEV